MQAVISGNAGRAVIFDGDSLKSLDLDHPTKVVPRKRSDLPYLLGEMKDLRVIETTDIESVKRELKYDRDSSWALDLTLISLDAELPNHIRKEAIGGLEELIADARIAERLENVLYSRPLPADADLAGALELCAAADVSSVLTLLRRFEARDSLIDEISNEWDSIPTKVFGDYDRQAEFMRTAVSEGLFRALVIANETETVSTFLLNAGLNKSITQLRNHREVLQQWTRSFRRSAETPGLEDHIEEEGEGETQPRRRHGRRVGLDRPAMLREVNRRKGTIVAALHRRDLALFALLVNELVDYQRTAEPVHVAKTLCDLAMEAKTLGMFSLQLELTERSVNIAPDDAWSWAQYGDALLNMHRLDDALAAYHQARAFGAGAIAGTGKAEVLKAQGDLPSALAAFDEVISAHPENVVAKAGRAEVLKAQGNLPAALAAFNEIIRAHPENVVAKNGRAEVLKAQGDLPSALLAFDEVIRAHPDDVVAKNGRAEVLKAQGDLPSALLAFDEVIRAHPENVVAKNGRAEVLKAQGDLPSSLLAFEEVIRAHPDDAVAKTGRAEVLKAQGDLPSALLAFDEVIRAHPDDVVATTGRAEVLKAQGDLPSALLAFDEVIRTHPENVVAKNGRAEVLKVRGSFNEAIAAYDEILLRFPYDDVARNGRSCVLVTLGRYPEALESLPTSTPQTLEDWIGYHIRGMILLRTGKRSEAIRIFQEGAENTPWQTSKDYFVTALGLAWMRGRDFEKASAALEGVRSPSLQPAANVLRIHAFGAQGNVRRATEAYDSLAAFPHFRSNELTLELRDQFILGLVPGHTEEWINDREDRIVLLAA